MIIARGQLTRSENWTAFFWSTTETAWRQQPTRIDEPMSHSFVFTEVTCKGRTQQNGLENFQFSSSSTLGTKYTSLVNIEELYVDMAVTYLNNFSKSVRVLLVRIRVGNLHDIHIALAFSL
ncbi:hypothetical protein ACFE04_019831 [Oxalis oulophora]